MKKSLPLVLLGLVLLAVASPVFAQEHGEEAAGSSAGLIAIAAGFSMAFASGLCGLGQGKAISAACDGAARNPGMAAKLQLMMIIGLAFIESLALYAMVVVFVKVG